MIYTKVWDDFPSTKVRSFLTETEDGDYIIVINPRMARCQQVKGYWHEMRHIIRKDFGKPVQIAEKECHESEEIAIRIMEMQGDS